MSEQLEIKSIEEAADQTVQSRVRQPVHSGLGLLYWLSASGELVGPWWSRQRDRDLRRFVKGSDHLSGAFFTLQSKLTSVPVWVEARDRSVASHVKQAAEFTRILVDESEFGRGWITAFSKFLEDVWTCDNGGFFEIIGPGDADGPLTGPATGIAHLDSWRCVRTSNYDYPVVYESSNGPRYKLHRSRVVDFAQYPSAIDEMHGVGFSWASRAINVAQNLTDIARYKQEKLGSRPLRGMLVGKRIPEGLIASALQIAAVGMDAKGLGRFAQIPVIDNLDADASLELIDLASLPDGFDEQTSITLGMYAIALAGAVPPRWLWPATASGATKADAMFQHFAGASGGPGQLLRAVQIALGGSERGDKHSIGKFLPPHLKLVFDFQDDVLDEQAASIRAVRATTRSSNLTSGVTTIRVEREKMVADGELSEGQFIEMELQDGRTPDGVDVLALFRSEDPTMQGLLALGVANPLDIAANDAAAMVRAIGEAELDAAAIMMSAGSANVKRGARMALAALLKLRDKYEQRGASPGIAEPDDNGDEADDATPEDRVMQEADAALANPATSMLDKALAMAIRNHADGDVTADDLASFAVGIAGERDV